MKARIALAATGLSVLLAGAAQAQAYVWKEVGSGPGVTVFYNPLTVSTESGVTTVTTRRVYSPPQPGANLSGQAVMVASVVEKMGINCAANTSSDLMSTYHDASGAELYSQGNVHGQQPIPAGSLASSMAPVVCK